MISQYTQLIWSATGIRIHYDKPSGILIWEPTGQMSSLTYRHSITKMGEIFDKMEIRNPEKAQKLLSYNIKLHTIADVDTSWGTRYIKENMKLARFAQVVKKDGFSEMVSFNFRQKMKVGVPEEVVVVECFGELEAAIHYLLKEY